MTDAGAAGFSDTMLAEAMHELLVKHATGLQAKAVATQWQADTIGDATFRRGWVPAVGDWALYFGMSPGCCGFVGKVLRVGQGGSRDKLEIQWETPEGLEDPCWEAAIECAPLTEEWIVRLESLPYEARKAALQNLCNSKKR